MKKFYLAVLLVLCFSAAGWADFDPQKLIAAGRSQVGVTTGYDGSYRKIPYPGGDGPAKTGYVPTFLFARTGRWVQTCRSWCTKTWRRTLRFIRANGA